MTIKKRMYDIKPGTGILCTGDELIVINSEYDNFHDWYEYHKAEYDAEGNEILIDKHGRVKPVELIGGEILNY